MNTKILHGKPKMGKTTVRVSSQYVITSYSIFRKMVIIGGIIVQVESLSTKKKIEDILWFITYFELLQFHLTYA
jgi:hypothetical protein